MKRLLLDTHVFIWWMSGSANLGSMAIKQISDPENKVFISAVSVWEMMIKRQLGKLECPDNLDSIIEELGFEQLDISAQHAVQTDHLPMHHKDPFDRMLIAQSQVDGLQIITKDERFSDYQVSLIDATL